MHVSEPEMLSGNLVNADQVMNDLDEALKRLDMSSIDVVTFSGTGEPTLNLRLDDIAEKVKKRVKGFPLVILTNSSLFYRKDVRENLKWFDLVVAKLDAGDDETFRAINRPVDKRLNIQTIIDSIKKLRKDIKGAIALEVMLLRSKGGQVTNVEGKSLQNLIDAVLDTNPDHAQLEVPYRPPSESFVKPPTQRKIKQISNELSRVMGEDKLWVYGLHDKRGRSVTWFSHESLEKEAVELLKRRPCRVLDVSASLGIDLAAAQSLLKRLGKKRTIVIEMSKGEKYYSYRNSNG